jgi:transcriptional regulator with PAS, ATPase and Fis domain
MSSSIILSNNPETAWNELITGNGTLFPVPHADQKINIEYPGYETPRLEPGKVMKLQRLHKEMVSMWNLKVRELTPIIHDGNYICLFDQNGYVISSVSPDDLGVQCRVANDTAIRNQLNCGMPVEVKTNYEYKNVSFNQDNHEAIIFPIPGDDGTMQCFLSAGCFNSSVPEEMKSICYLGSSLLTSHYKNSSMLKRYSRSFMNAIHQPAILLDDDGNILNINHDLTDLLRVKLDSLAGEHINQILLEESRIREDEGFNAYLLNKTLLFSASKSRIIRCSLTLREPVSLPDGSTQFLFLLDAANHKSFSNILVDFSSVEKADVTPFDKLIGSSSAMTKIKTVGKKIAKSMSNVLIEGESGTGKELLAQAIHLESNRAGPFLAINCGAITKELLNSELFGYEEGAFTGAKKGGNKGKFEIADKGTVFLDEIGEMPLDMQVSLLRFLQDRMVMRLGGSKPVKVDVRIIAATNRDLRSAVQQGEFRKDLYYRLNVSYLKIPPLRARREDIPDLVAHMMKNLCKELVIDIPNISDNVMDILINYNWPGNARELQNVIESMLVLCVDNSITVDLLPEYLLVEDIKIQPSTNNGSLKMIEFERKAIISAFNKCNGNITQTARELGIGRTTLYRKFVALDITRYCS